MDDSDSENEAEEIEMAEEEIVENVKFKKETKLDFDQRNCRSGFSFPVVPEKMKEKGIGIDINLITPEIADSPEQIYSLIYGSTFHSLTFCTNLAINDFNLMHDTSQSVNFVSDQEIRIYFGIRILIKIEKGNNLSIREFFYQRLTPREFNMFSVLKCGENSSKINLISYKRYIQITGFLTLGGKKEYVKNCLADIIYLDYFLISFSFLVTKLMFNNCRNSAFL